MKQLLMLALLIVALAAITPMFAQCAPGQDCTGNPGGPPCSGCDCYNCGCPPDVWCPNFGGGCPNPDDYAPGCRSEVEPVGLDKPLNVTQLWTRKLEKVLWRSPEPLGKLERRRG